MKKVKYIMLLLVCIALAGCSLKKAATTMTARIATEGMVAVEAETDLWIAKESIIPMVKTLEVLRAGDPDNMEFSGLMAKVYGNIAFGFFEPIYLTAKHEERPLWRERIRRYYRLGYESGFSALEKRFGKRIRGPVPDLESAIGKAGKKDLGTLFWTAFDLGSWVNLKRDDITSVAMLPKAGAIVDRVLEIDRNFGYGSALAFKAAMLASRPEMLGGDPGKALELFTEADRINDGKYLMNKVMFAEWYAIPHGDMGLVRRLLDEVISADPDALPEQALANRLAQERARILRKEER